MLEEDPWEVQQMEMSQEMQEESNSEMLAEAQR